MLAGKGMPIADQTLNAKVPFVVSVGVEDSNAEIVKGVIREMGLADNVGVMNKTGSVKVGGRGFFSGPSLAFSGWFYGQRRPCFATWGQVSFPVA